MAVWDCGQGVLVCTADLSVANVLLITIYHWKEEQSLGLKEEAAFLKSLPWSLGNDG